MSTADSVQLHVELEPRIHLAAQQNSVPTLRRVEVENLSPDPIEGVQVRFSADPAFFEPFSVEITRIDPAERRALPEDGVNPWVSPSRLMKQSERQAGALFVEVEAGGELLRRERYDVAVLAPNEWAGVSVLPELLAAFVLPNHAALTPVLEQAADLLGSQGGESSGLSGYQSNSPEYVYRMVQALYAAMQATGVRYANPPASFESNGQRIRTPDQVLHGLGTCLDLTVVMAALMEQVGLHPFLVVVEGHAFPGCWLYDFMLGDPTVDDVAVISKRLRLGQAVVFDSSPIAAGSSFEAAQEQAERMLEDTQSFRFVVDVARARAHRILPLSFELPSYAESAKAPSTGPEVAKDAPLVLPRYQAPDVASTPGERLPGVRDVAMARRERWKGKLLDLSLRNRLLNFKATKRAVELPFVNIAELEDELAVGKELQLAPSPSSFDADDPRSAKLHEARLREDALRELIREDQAKGLLHTSATPAALDKTLIELFRSARTVREETGVSTLYFALGMLRWFESTSSAEPRRAPILLVPVELRRHDGGRRYTVSKSEEETRVNVTLLKKLEADYGLKPDGFDELPEDDKGLDVPLILAQVARLIADMPRWDVEDACYLSEFSFAKFLMWQDLEGRLDDLRDNPLFTHILEGKKEAFPLAAPLVPEQQLDSARPATEMLTVVDADPSQLQAVLAAEAGSSFVLQGPPGTGKSQTITNLIGHLLGQGRTVLFVSEKMAALDVVHSRLAAAGLGPFCLELHSNKANKRLVLEQLKSSFVGSQGATDVGWGGAAAELEASRAELNEFARLLGRPTPFGPSVQAALCRLIARRESPCVPLHLEGDRAFEKPVLERLEEATRELIYRWEATGSEPVEHPWRASRASEWSEAWERQVKAALQSLREAVAEVGQAYLEVRRVLEVDDEATSFARLGRVRAVAASLLESGAPPRALIQTARGQELQGRLEEWSLLVQDRRARYAAVTAVFRDALLELDLHGLLARFKKWAGSFFLVRFFALMGARKQLKTVLTAARLPAATEIVSTLEEAVELDSGNKKLMKVQPEASSLFGARWRGADTDLEDVQTTLERSTRFRKQALLLSDDLSDDAAFERWCGLYTDRHELVATDTPRGEKLSAFVAAYDRCDAARRHLEALVSLEPGDAYGANPTLDALDEYVRGLEAELNRLRPYCLARGAGDRARQLGLRDVCERLERGAFRINQLEEVLERSFLQLWWEGLVRREPRLREFQGRSHMAKIDRFKSLDARNLELARAEVVARIASRAPAPEAPGDEMGLLRSQFQRKRAHMPIRKLFSKIPGVLRRLKPCVLMSPLSVAQYLDPSLERFDVVIFDEASQIPPWDAVGAIARGHQVIIVGDTKQLPPTSFFDKSGRIEDDSDYDEHDLEDLESILNEALATGVQEHYLKWHYRSRHESLIAFSNHKYYGGRLRTFPSAAHRVAGLGVELRAVPDGFYDRGASRTNRAEAAGVVAEVVRILDDPRDQKSVGVVTFSQAQQSLIQDLVDKLLQERKDLIERFESSSNEHVFIKNLENVQGDERDVMLFSICYGPDRAGKVTMNFGPLNREGGERRLNVAITRARERLVVFSTLRADQIDISKTRAMGAKHLKTFLDYAERGIAAIDAELSLDGGEPDSPFEEEVIEVLRDRGWAVTPQVGVSGYRIDIGVEHPDRPGAFVLAVECDGAAYHSSLYARERDRLRQAVLEGLGWRIHRIWSTDWWYDRDNQIKQLLAAVEAAVAVSRAAPEPKAETVSTPRVVPAAVQPKVKPPAADSKIAEKVEALLLGEAPTLAPAERHATYAPPELPILGSSEDFYESRTRGAIGRMLGQVVKDYGPIAQDSAYRAVASGWGLSGLGSRIRRILDGSLRSLPARSRPKVVDGAFYDHDEPPDVYRGFRVPDPRDPRTKRKIDEIPRQEIANAADHILHQGKSMGRDDLAKETARLLGTERMGKKVVAVVDAAIDRLVEQRRAVVSGDRISAP